MAKYLIVGGVAGGASTAARLRRLDEQAEIILFEQGKEISYANCGLPYYLGGIIADRQQLLLQTPASFSQRFNLSVRVESEVKQIYPAKRTVSVLNRKSGEVYHESYDKLLLAPGAKPIVPPLPGVDLPGIFVLHSIDDSDRIKEFCQRSQPRRALVVGAGFVGLEMAENLHHAGIAVAIVEMGNQVMAPIDLDMAAHVHEHLRTQGVGLYLQEAVTAIAAGPQGALKVALQSGQHLEVDLVILSIGVRPNSGLAKNAQLAIGERTGGIQVNEYMQTSDPNIYAVGDVIEFPHPLLSTPVTTYLAGPANKQARIAADNMVLGNVRTYQGSIATAAAKIFDLTVAATGVAAKILVREKIPHESIIIHSYSHAGYYPDATPLMLKLVFDVGSGKVWGGQIVGYDGVDKRIDLMATVIKNQGTIFDLQGIEHAYAPPYSSAKDPVNMLGFVAENVMQGRMQVIHASELLANNRSDGLMLINVATAEEFALGTIPGSINIPLDSLRERYQEIPKNKKVVVFCTAGLRGYLAVRILQGQGFVDVHNLSGGYTSYKYLAQVQDNRQWSKEVKVQRPLSAPHPSNSVVVQLDTCGLSCPGPIKKLKEQIDKLAVGARILQRASDPGFAADIRSWCQATGHQLIGLELKKNIVEALIEKSAPVGVRTVANGNGNGNDKTLIVFSDDLDRALATFVITNGALSMGRKVTLFCTFWGLNIIKKRRKPSVVKDLMAKMFSIMMPSSSCGLKLSKMHMGGIGTWMMRKRMQSLQIESLESMIASALAGGVEIIACQMSMDVMGVKKEELFDQVKIGGVANYLHAAESANLNLFL